MRAPRTCHRQCPPRRIAAETNARCRRGGRARRSASNTNERTFLTVGMRRVSAYAARSRPRGPAYDAKAALGRSTTTAGRLGTRWRACRCTLRAVGPFLATTAEAAAALTRFGFVDATVPVRLRLLGTLRRACDASCADNGRAQDGARVGLAAGTTSSAHAAQAGSCNGTTATSAASFDGVTLSSAAPLLNSWSTHRTICWRPFISWSSVVPLPIPKTILPDEHCDPVKAQIVLTQTVA